LDRKPTKKTKRNGTLASPQSRREEKWKQPSEFGVLCTFAAVFTASFALVSFYAELIKQE